MMNNVRGRALFVNSEFPKARSVSAPPAQEHTHEVTGHDQKIVPVVMPSYNAMRQLAVSSFYIQKLKTGTALVLDLLSAHITMLEGGSTDQVPHEARNKLIEGIWLVFPAELRLNHSVSPVALSCMKQFDSLCESILANVECREEKGQQGHILTALKSQYALMTSLASVLIVDGQGRQDPSIDAQQKKEGLRTALKETGTQTTKEMVTQEVQATSVMRQAQVQTGRLHNVAHANTQSMVPMHSQATQSKPNVRASHMQTVARPLTDRGTQFLIEKGEFSAQTTPTPSVLTRKEWDQMHEAFASVRSTLSKKIIALLDRKKSAAFTIEKAQHLVAPYATAFDQLEHYLNGQCNPTQEIKQEQSQVIGQLCDSLQLIERYRSMVFVAMFPIEEGARHNGLQALAKELEQLRYQRAASVLQLLQEQTKGHKPDPSVTRLAAMKPDGMPWSLQNKDPFLKILARLHEDVEDYILDMDKKLSNYHSTHTEESIVGVLVNAFLPLVVQIAGAAASAASDSSKKSDLDQYNQFMNDCQVLLSKKIGLLMSKLAGENKEQDQKMLNSLISMMQPVAPQNKEKQVNALPQVSAANELPVSPNENKEITHWPEYLAKMAGVTKWKELDLALIGNLTKKVAHDIYQVDFYNRQDLKDDMWPQFRNVLQLEVNIKKSLQQVKERKKKNNAMEKAHLVTLGLFEIAFKIANEVYKERAKEMDAMRKI